MAKMISTLLLDGGDFGLRGKRYCQYPSKTQLSPFYIIIIIILLQGLDSVAATTRVKGWETNKDCCKTASP